MGDWFEAISGISGDLFPQLNEKWLQLMSEPFESEDLVDGRNIEEEIGNLGQGDNSQCYLFSEYSPGMTERTTQQRRSRKQSLQERNFDCPPPSISQGPRPIESENATILPMWKMNPDQASSAEEKKQILHAIKSRKDRVRKQAEKEQLINTIKKQDCQIEKLATSVKNMQDTVEKIRLENANLRKANCNLKKAITSLTKE